MLPRRTVLSGLAACGACPLGPQTDKPLRDLAREKNIRFGSAVNCADFAADPSYATLIARECDIITPSIEAKWRATEAAEGAFRFGPLDRLVNFATNNQIRLHMHNLIWAVDLPQWTTDALKAGRGRAIMQHHIATVVGRYRGRVHSWDVVNEPIDPRWPADADGLCTTPWRMGVGPDFISDAITDAALADPNAQLMINDDDLEYDAPDRDQKRTSYLRLIERLLRRGVPLQGFGLEAHLKPWLRIAETKYARFLRELAGFGLKIHITEFDINDRWMPADIGTRDRAVAETARHYLDLVLNEPAVVTLITWGLSDSTTWMLHDNAGRRPDGLAPRPLPYDTALRPKELRTAIADALRAAPSRPG